MAAFDERRFQARQSERMLMLLRIGLLAGVAIFPLFAIWEAVIAGDHLLWASLKLRLLFGGLLLGLLPLTRLPGLAARCEAIFYAACVISGSGVAVITQVVPNGHTHALGALGLTIVVILVVSTTLRTAVISLGCFLASANVVLLAHQWPHLIEINFFLGGAAVTACVLAFTLERNARAAFGLELDLEDERKQLAHLASTDSLTSIENRRSFLQKGEYLVRSAQRYERPLSILMIDVDRFKEINDACGHHVGDLTLRSLAQAVKKAIRTTDVFGRLGGEEFGVVLPETDALAAARLAERLRKQLEELEIDLSPGSVQFTVSVGVTSISSKKDTLDVLVQRADQALYDAKRGGRNRVRVTT